MMTMKLSVLCVTLLPLVAAICTYDGNRYKNKDTFPATDGCNTCTCNKNIISCTEKACNLPCDYNGIVYNHGDSFKATDGCNDCFCTNGAVACTKKLCAPCEYHGRTYKSGENFTAPDGCNTCTCIDGQVSCTEKLCDVCPNGELDGFVCFGFAGLPCPEGLTCSFVSQNPDQGGKCCYDAEPCVYSGTTYKDGESFTSVDGCNKCSCSSGSVLCTLRACVSTCKWKGKQYIEGETITKGSPTCEGCTCQKGQWNCSPLFCPACVAEEPRPGQCCGDCITDPINL